MMGRLIYWWWAPIAIALAVVIAWETNWGEAINKPIVVAAAPEPKPVAPALLPEYKATAGPEAYAEIVDRPLFSPSRKPAPPPPPPEQPKPQMQMGQYQLTGTIEVGNKLYAFLKEVKSGKGLRAAQGDVLATGLKLAKVEPDRVVFTQYDGEEEVRLVVAKSTRLTPTAPAPGAPGAPGTPGAPGAPTAAAPGAPTAPGAPPQPGGTPAPPPAQPPLPSSIRPGATTGATVAPFVPGVSPLPRTEANPETPRRRGAQQ
jgi:hypothetical protein